MNRRFWNKNNKGLLGLVILPIIFVFAVKIKIYFVPYSICIYKYLTGHGCWGCGMLHAFNALFNFKFHEAFNFNPRIVLVAPLMLFAWVQALIAAIKNRNLFIKSDIVDR